MGIFDWSWLDTVCYCRISSCFDFRLWSGHGVHQKGMRMDPVNHSMKLNCSLAKECPWPEHLTSLCQRRDKHIPSSLRASDGTCKAFFSLIPMSTSSTVFHFQYDCMCSYWEWCTLCGQDLKIMLHVHKLHNNPRTKFLVRNYHTMWYCSSHLRCLFLGHQSTSGWRWQWRDLNLCMREGEGQATVPSQ